jgi:hypothetical protein
VIGHSDRQGRRPATEAYTPANLLATVLHYLFDLGRLRLRTDLSRDRSWYPWRGVAGNGWH